jgi:hypothetical protein
MSLSLKKLDSLREYDRNQISFDEVIIRLKINEILQNDSNLLSYYHER